MPQLENEIDANYASFFKDWTAQAVKNWRALHSNGAYKISYRRLCAIQAIKSDLIVSRYSAGSAAFFFEAHNDALISHVNASVGAWRSALQALRSCLENTLNAVYYNDHPIELELWQSGRFILGFAELLRYAEKHPRLSPLGAQLSGLSTMQTEYATLSKAVHASAANFRMTDSVSSVLLWNADPIKVGMWATRERKVVEAVSLLMVCLHSSSLQGTALTQLRGVLSFSISREYRRKLRQAIRVNIPD